MSTTSTSVVAPPHIPSRNGLHRFRRGRIERISLTATILVLFAVTLFVGTAVFLVRSLLPSYEGQQRLLGVTETQSRRIEEQDKHIASINERISQIN
ncbi:MAG TPA: hypothetical protein VFM05_03420, partial [Candidatus Saccharimonadales bacterium]|nr:hypothetical protein [Candidatus Saccharimonadales bacterium]